MINPIQNPLVKRAEIDLEDYSVRQGFGLMLMPANQLTKNLVNKIKTLTDNQTKIFFDLIPSEQNDQNLEKIMDLDITDKEVTLFQNVDQDSRDYRILQDLRNTPPEQTRVFSALGHLFQNFDNLQTVKKLVTPSFSEHHWDSLIHIFVDQRSIEALHKITALTNAQAQVFAATQEPFFYPRKTFEILKLITMHKITEAQAKAFTAMPLYYRTTTTLKAILNLTPTELKTFNELQHDEKVKYYEKKKGMSKMKAYGLIDGQQGKQYKERFEKITLTPSQLKVWFTIYKNHGSITKLEAVAKLTEAQTEAFNNLNDVEKNHETLTAISKLTDNQAKALNHLRTNPKSPDIKNFAKLTDAQALVFTALPRKEATIKNLTIISRDIKPTDAQALAFTKTYIHTKDLHALKNTTALNEEQAKLFASLKDEICSLTSLEIISTLTTPQINAFKSLTLDKEISTESMRIAATLTKEQAEAFISLQPNDRLTANMTAVSQLNEMQAKALSTLPPGNKTRIQDFSKLQDETAKAYAERPAADRNKGLNAFKFSRNRTAQTKSWSRG